MKKESQLLVNRVANSGLITINLENYFPEQEIVELDIKEFLFHGLILREKDFRSSLKAINWIDYKGKILCIHCSADAIIPVWAFMLISGYAQPYAELVYQGNIHDFLNSHFHKILTEMDYTSYDDQRIVIKGCSNKPVPPSAYSQLTSQLRPHAQSIMYGEPCSTVPIFKRPRKVNRKKT